MAAEGKDRPLTLGRAGLALLVGAMSGGAHERIAICFVEWSGVGSQKVVIDRTVISDGEMRTQPHRAFAPSWTNPIRLEPRELAR